MKRSNLIAGALPALVLAALLAVPAWLGAAEATAEEPGAEEHQADAWSHRGRSPEEWAELAEHWERWGEEFAERWGEEFAERWGEEHAESWQRWAEEMAERGEGWEQMGEEIGRTVEKALGEIDWEAIGRSVEESMKAIESTDWEAVSEQIERRMEELERRLEEQSEAAPSDE